MFLKSLAALVALCVYYAQADVLPVKCSLNGFPIPVQNLPADFPCVPTTLPVTLPSVGPVIIQQAACPVTQIDCEYECNGSE